MKKKGFSLIELVVVVALVAILLSVASLSGKKIIEGRALEKAKNQVAETMRSYVERSYNEGENYRIEVDSGNKTLEAIIVKTPESTVEKIELPENLSYFTSPSGSVVMTRDITVDEEFEVYIRSENQNKYKILVEKKQVTELISATTYEYKGKDEDDADVWEEE